MQPLALLCAAYSLLIASSFEALAQTKRTVGYAGGKPVPRSDILHFVPPDYPYDARSKRLQGSGVYRLMLDFRTGTVTSVTALKSTGVSSLDKNVIDALRQWRVKPGIWHGMDVPITFTMGASGLAHQLPQAAMPITERFHR